MLGSEICLTWRATPFSNDSQFQDIFFLRGSPDRLQVPGKAWTKLTPPQKNDGIPVSEEQRRRVYIPRLKSNMIVGLSCSGWKHRWPRILLRSLAAESVLQLQHHDSWDSSQTPHVTTAQWCKRPTHYYNCGKRQIYTEMINCLLLVRHPS